MKLSELKKLVDFLEANSGGEDTEVRFSDYSHRSYPMLDIERPVERICEYGSYVDRDGAFFVPLDSVGG